MTINELRQNKQQFVWLCNTLKDMYGIKLAWWQKLLILLA